MAAPADKENSTVRIGAGRIMDVSMTTRRSFLLAVAIAMVVPSIAVAESCQTVASRFEIAAKTRLAAEKRPIHIRFDTRAEGVRLPDYLKAQYPNEMTIVLQFEFDRLKVYDDRIEVTVRFKGKPARLVIPFSAVTGFWYDGARLCSAE